MIWLGLIGSAYVSGKNEHVSIDYFLKKLNHKKRALLNRLIGFIILFFAFFVMIFGGGHLVFVTIKLEQLSPSLQIPLGLVYSVIPLSGLIIIFYQISNIKK